MMPSQPPAGSMQIDVTQDTHNNPPANEVHNPETALTKKRKKDASTAARTTERVPGKSLLPLTRVQKILKADTELPTIARDAQFLISIATEEFVKRLAEAAQKVAERSQRATVQQQDLATVVRKSDEFLFLDEVITFAQRAPREKAKPRALEAQDERGPLDQFMQTHSVPEDSSADAHDSQLHVNEDGTMVMDADTV